MGGHALFPMVVQGDVAPSTLVLNVGSDSHELEQFSTKQLTERRRHLRAAIQYRRRLSWLPRFAVLPLAAILWLASLDAAMGDESTGRLLATLRAVVALVASFGVGWLGVRIFLGAWVGRQRRTRAQLETVLAKIDAELDMRRPTTEFTTSQLVRRVLNKRASAWRDQRNRADRSRSA